MSIGYQSRSFGNYPHDNVDRVIAEYPADAIDQIRIWFEDLKSDRLASYDGHLIVHRPVNSSANRQKVSSLAAFAMRVASNIPNVWPPRTARMFGLT